MSALCCSGQVSPPGGLPPSAATSHLVRPSVLCVSFAKASNRLQTLVAIDDILGDWLTAGGDGGAAGFS